ncbi:hypothetical protein R1flu_015497 [Riccia fluitans]|uniref:Uncharacterized protein n=1 Tax=Riccia fluitans TaxID=41844 RepID=A0ABD1YJ39_9MARC
MLTATSNQCLSSGDNVILCGTIGVVAEGCIHSIDPIDFCHSIQLGPNRLLVQVLIAFDGNQALPYSSPGADTLFEAVGLYVIWDSSQVDKIGVGQANDVVPGSSIEGHFLLEVGPSKVADSQHAGVDERQKTHIGTDHELYFKLQKNWCNVQVVVEGLPIAEGVIFLPFANSSEMMSKWVRSMQEF